MLGDLRIASKDLYELASGHRPKLAQQSAPSEHSHPSVEQLPLCDRELLRAAIGDRSLIDFILNDSQLCEEISVPALAFINQVAAIDSLGLEQDDARDAIKQLLGEWGQSWKQLWISAFELRSSPEVNFHQIFEGCKQKYRRDRDKRIIEDLRGAAANSSIRK